MERPAKEAVDHALVMVDNHLRAFPESRMSLGILAAEVRALREELGNCEEEFRKPPRDEIERLKTDLEWQVACCKALQESQERLAAEGVHRNWLYERQVATSARVEALCDMQHDDRLIRVGDIRAALRGGK